MHFLSFFLPLVPSFCISLSMHTISFKQKKAVPFSYLSVFSRTCWTLTSNWTDQNLIVTYISVAVITSWKSIFWKLLLQAKLVLERNRTSRLRISIANYSRARARADNYSYHVELFTFTVVASCSLRVSAKNSVFMSVNTIQKDRFTPWPGNDYWSQGSCGGSIEFVHLWCGLQVFVWCLSGW